MNLLKSFVPTLNPFKKGGWAGSDFMEDDSGPKPNAPGYTGLTKNTGHFEWEKGGLFGQPKWVPDANAGELDDKYKLNAAPDVGFHSNMDELNKQLGGINLNTDVLGKLREMALKTGPSDWANTMLQKQGVEEGNALDKAGATSNAGTAAAYSALGTHGGMSAGARERLAAKGARDLTMGRQGIFNQGITDRLGINATDQQQHMDLMKALPGMEVQSLDPALRKTSIWGEMANSEAGRHQQLDLSNRDYSTGVQKTNIENLIGDRKGQNDYNLGKYNSDMSAWAANKTAVAQANSSKK